MSSSDSQIASSSADVVGIPSCVAHTIGPQNPASIPSASHSRNLSTKSDISSPRGPGDIHQEGEEEGAWSDAPRRRAGQVSHQSHGRVTRLRKSRNGSSHIGTRFNLRSLARTFVTSAGVESTPAAAILSTKNAFFCVG